jgi:DNA (cytosine-5)-methyltransferase 1
MKVGTFFSGVGSPEQALRNLGIKHEIEFACDIDKYAKETYLKNFKPKEFYNDITSLNMKDLAYVDLLVFGFPCQAFSLAGKRQGFEDTRGTLFYDTLRYLKEHKPRYFIAENVKGLLSHDNGKTFQTIIDCLAKTTNYQMSLMPFDNLGYHIHYKVLNTKDFGLPQNRERIFIIGIRDDKDNNFNFPKEIPLELKLKDILQDNPNSKYNLSKNTILEKGRGNVLYHRKGFATNTQVYDINKICGTIDTCTGGGRQPHILVEEKYYLSEEQYKKINISNETKGAALRTWPRTSNPDKDREEGRSKRLELRKDDLANSITTHEYDSILWTADYRNDEGLRIKTHSLYPRSSKTGKGGTGHLSKEDGTAYCLDTGNTQAIEKQNRIRRLTPIECERLQGFPDNFTEGVSDTQRYKQMGNTITVNVIQAILKNKLG